MVTKTHQELEHTLAVAVSHEAVCLENCNKYGFAPPFITIYGKAVRDRQEAQQHINEHQRVKKMAKSLHV